MLFSFGRAAVQRLASRPVATPSHHRLVSALAARLAVRKPNLAWSCAASSRFFASSGRLKKTTTTIKTVTKKKATTKAGAKPKKTTTKAKKKPVKKPVRKTATTAAKPKRTRSAKTLSPEKQARKKRVDLKARALFTEPKQLPSTPWLVFLGEATKGHKLTDSLGGKSTEASAAFKSLSSSELSRLQSTVEQNKLANAAAHKAWVESHTPEDIAQAIKARHTLAREFNYPKKKKTSIRDERQPKRATGPFGYYTKARWASGDFANSKLVDVARAIGQEWRSLSEAEKEPYRNLGESEKHRYEKDVAATFHHSVRRP
ncbi:hypothetical protein BJ170DRAFT_38741 [Xylariales sp. AK1849]|nr:hypothetical protein BJ170DRAFT_38741 [Xylariales sp. AK1849]